jgi:hypothetical protein
VGRGATVTREHLHQLVEALPERVVVTAAQVLEGLRRLGEEPPSGELAAASEPPREGVFVTEALRQRLGPPTAVAEAPPNASIDELAGDFWPEDEDPDDFTATIRRWRDADRRTADSFVQA